ncbi:restriction endonuclease subunit S [Domibacillus iocasae]|uniref:Type I restriction modification DNA specificity domain-containing protein n=1 Tax=Domibacillus iocasae TaxID=1714016 RepID=A0A1E7DQK2_9BACI|nr:restriction endonuclease subunit S [Domibacillus iocasae]OES45367.1 hypothetical protein BA724_05020 [Domibacillus iocasae]
MSKYQFEQIVFNSTKKKKPIQEDKYTYLGLEHLDPGSLEVTRYGTDVAPIGEKLIMKEGDVLFGKRRAYQKKVAIAPFDGIFSAHGMVLRPKEEVIDKNFFPLFVSSDYFLDAAIKISVGSLSPTINWRDLKRLEFELPEMDKQRELAKVLWSIDATKKSYQKLLQKTDELVKSQFIEMFGELEQNQKGWGLTTLGQCCELNPKRPRDIDDNTLVSFVAMPSVSANGQIDTTIVKSYGEVKKGYTYFAENDVLFAKITPCMENGKGAIAKGLSSGIGTGSTEFHVLRPLDGVSNPYWLYIITMFESFRKNARKVMTGTGGQLRVPISFLSEYPISLPPIELQNKFAAFVQQSNKSKFELEQVLAELTATYRKIISENLG